MVKRHLKRHATAKTWPIKRKGITFIVRPRSGAHPLSSGMSIATVLKLLGFCTTTKEVKTALNSQDVFINDRKETDFKAMIGFMDVLSIPEKKLFFRATYDVKGKLLTVPIDEKDSMLVLCRVRGITMVAGGKIQFNCLNGFNILSDKKIAQVNDVLLYDLKKKKIVQVFPLKAGTAVFMTGGNLIGHFGEYVKAERKTGVVLMDKKESHTSLNYIFVVGDKKPAIKLQ